MDHENRKLKQSPLSAIQIPKMRMLEGVFVTMVCKMGQPYWGAKYASAESE